MKGKSLLFSIILIILNLAAILALYTLAKNTYVAWAVTLDIVLCIIAQLYVVFINNIHQTLPTKIARILLVLLLAYNIYFTIRVVAWLIAKPQMQTIVIQ